MTIAILTCTAFVSSASFFYHTFSVIDVFSHHG